MTADGHAASTSISDLPLDAYVLDGSGVRSSRAAVIDAASGETVSRADLCGRVDTFAALLGSCGVGDGDVAATLLGNSPSFPTAFFGTIRSGAACTSINPSLTAREIAAQLRASGARLLAAAPGDLAKAQHAVDLLTTRPGVVEIVPGGRGVLRLVGEIPDRHVPAGAADVAALPYSSGTTGLPKGVMLTHRNLVANADQCGVWGLGEDDVVIAVAPFFHIMGMSAVMVAGLRWGATLVTMPRFDLHGFLAAVQRYRVTCAVLAPPVIAALARDPGVDAYDLGSLRWIISGAAPLDVATLHACAERLDCAVGQAWGMSECGLGSAGAAGEGPAASVGRAVAGAQLRIVDPDTGAEMPDGAAGELLIRGPNVMKGYLHDPRASAAVLDDAGWLRTGDAARLDADGYLTIVDRYKELIKYKGFQVAPAELEAVLLAHPAVVDAAVVRHPDAVAGEVPKAFLVLRPDLMRPETAEDVIRWASARVAGYKQIRHVELIDSVPRSPTGKILRRLLSGGDQDA